MKDYSKVWSHLIRKFGQTLLRKPRIVNESTGEITYGDQETITGWVEQITGYTELWERLGLLVEADYRVTFPADTTVNVGDLIKVDDDWCIVAEKIYRKIGNKVHAIECLLRKRK